MVTGDKPQQFRKQPQPANIVELPVKVDIVDGADGLELYEIVFALQVAAQHLRSSDTFRARYLERLVIKYQTIQQNRLQQIKQYFQEKWKDDHSHNHARITNSKQENQETFP
ncbi:hypothetical protein G3578_00490 [Brevibacillus sp. SYP-B805]|uniref:hypothetical protein n=1 Tax=Brevibacillus sp. SYP-B805 TaxID=1578199 RepID=UPI0013ECB59A|nr:hypothetical protein [Brevibacillus sp. SYP-B805]NGQ93645.1 hypothetical protein [Brevibacillus sp. SYP-B805]